MSNFEMLEQDLKRSRLLLFSYSPDIPREETSYRYMGHTLLDTSTGKLLILNILSLETGIEETFAIPDIQEVDLHDFSTENHRKYYLACIVRPAFFELAELNQMKKAGIVINEDRLIELQHDSEMIHRIILIF